MDNMDAAKKEIEDYIKRLKDLEEDIASDRDVDMDFINEINAFKLLPKIISLNNNLYCGENFILKCPKIGDIS